MEKRYNKRLKIELPLLAFGAMRLPKSGEDIDFDTAKKMVDYAMENGLNYFDTAYPYHNGKSETFLGEALSGYDRSSYFLTDKLPIYNIKNHEDAEKYFDEQLEKCKTRYFDFYLLHAMNKERVKIMEDFNLYDFLLKKKAEGKIRYIGFSFHDDSDTLELLVSKYKWDFVQLQINYYDWNEFNAKEQYEILESHSLPCFVMEPVRGGFLSSLAAQAKKHMTDFNKDASISSWAIRWVASLPNVAVVLSGMSDMKQLKDNINTMSSFKPVSEDEINVIDKVVKELGRIKPIPCTGCKYCMPCPSGVNIPDIFAVYNNYKKTENKELFKNSYLINMKDTSRAHNCINCKACVSVCPQHIDIPKELKTVDSEVKALK